MAQTKIEERPYIIPRHRNFMNLAEMVSELIDQGYLPSGSMVIEIGPLFRDKFYYQPMIRKGHVGR